MTDLQKFLEKIKSNFLTVQFLTFLIIGGINTLNGMLSPYILSVWLPVNLAYVLSYIPNLAISYVLNSLFTFKDRKLSFQKCIKFYISYIPNFVIQNIVFIVVYNVLSLPKLAAIIGASILGIPITFLILKYFTFH